MTGFGAIAMTLSLAGCGSGESGNTAMPSVPPSLENVTETKPVTEDGISAAIESSAETDKILIAYFTWAENTADTSGVDANTSASVQTSGNMARMAAWIQQETGGDLFSIRVEEPYSADYETDSYAIGSVAERMELYRRCETEGVGISVMKAFSGGQLLDAKTSPFGKALTEYQCIQYALDKPGVMTVLSGVRST